MIISAIDKRVVENISRKKSVLEAGVLLVFFLLIFSVTEKLHAAAGDSISNTATINYDIAGVPASDSASASFLEDRVINFSVIESDGGSAVPVVSDMADAVLQFTVTNLGNASQDFLLTAVNTSPNPFGSPVDNFDPLAGTIQVFVESGVTPGYQAAEDTAVFVDEVISNTSRIVYVVADMPTQAIDDVSAIALIAQVAEGGAAALEGNPVNADDNGNISPAGIFSNGTTNMPAGIANTIPDSISTMETVFNDPAGLNVEDVSTDLNQDVASNGQHSDAGAYQVMSPVSIVKTVTVLDTLGGTDPHPGSTLRYQLDVTVSGNTAVDNLVISDAIPANTTYTDNSILLNTIAQTDADDAPIDYSQAIDILSKPVISIEVDLSQGGTVSVAPGVTNVIIFEVTID
ncbi:MAG: hypothetical protein KJN89_02195 [Gammaproteobacteria bacterium]|nr:hypothetical protein [Gammaproteobacteria bacterium]NNJ49158.1 hypothetical protein [Gammaproteobacteria bacterium]